MGKKGRPTKYRLTYAQRQWDNYSPYAPMKEPTTKELKEYYSEKQLQTMNKALSEMSNLAGYELNEAIITILSKRILGLVYN
jgi:hypothetical protein